MFKKAFLLYLLLISFGSFAQNKVDYHLPVVKGNARGYQMSKDGKELYYFVSEGNVFRRYGWNINTGKYLEPIVRKRNVRNEIILADLPNEFFVSFDRTRLAKVNFETGDTIVQNSYRYETGWYSIEPKDLVLVQLRHSKEILFHDKNLQQSTSNYNRADRQSGNLSHSVNQSGTVITRKIGKKLKFYFLDNPFEIIANVGKSSAADSAGLKKGDIILLTDDKPNSLQNPPALGTRKFKLNRNDTIIDIDMKRGANRKFGYTSLLHHNYLYELTGDITENYQFRRTVDSSRILLYKKYGKPDELAEYKLFNFRTGKTEREFHQAKDGKVLLTGIKEHIRITSLDKKGKRISDQLISENNANNIIDLPLRFSDSKVHSVLNNTDILVFVSNHQIELYNLKTKRTIQVFRTHSVLSVEALAVSKDKMQFVTANNKRVLRFDFNDRITCKQIYTNENEVDNLYYTNSDKGIISAQDGRFEHFSIDGDSISSAETPGSCCNDFDNLKSRDNIKYYFTTENINGSEIISYSLRADTMTWYTGVHLHQEFPPAAFLSWDFDKQDRQKLLIGFSNGEIRRYSFRYLHNAKTPGYSNTYNRVISIVQPDNENVLGVWHSGEIVKYDLELEQKDTLKLHEGDIESTFYDESNQRLITADNEGVVCFSSTLSFKKEKQLDFDFKITKISASADNRFYITICDDGIIRFLNSKNGKIEFLIVPFAYNDEFLIATPDGYFFGNKEVIRSIIYKKGTQYISGTEVELRYYRPDVILKRLGYADEDLIKKLEYQHKSRLEKSKIPVDDKAYNAVEIRSVDYDLTKDIGDTVWIDVNIVDKLQQGQRMVIYQSGAIVAEKTFRPSAKKIIRNIRLLLKTGDNRFMITVFNSYKQPSHYYDFSIYRKHESESDTRNYYFIGLANNKFDATGYDLTYAEKDIKDVSGLLKSKVEGQKDKFQQLILIGEQLDSTSVDQIKTFTQNSTPDDVIILYFAGHGILNNKLEYYLATKSSDFYRPKNGSISFNELESALNGVSAVNRVLFIDACHSGELDKNKTKISTNPQVKKGKVIFRGNQNVVEDQPSDQILMNDYFDDLRLTSGMNIITSSEGAEFSMEGSKWENGLFTYILKKIIPNKDVTSGRKLSEIAKELRLQVQNESSGKQNPSVRFVNPLNDFVLFR